ncbi:nicotinate-nucleotide adenylyltransferase [Alkalilimnicola ehrlichii]|uniref:nicotinate-nucleotide adenylyltransferase n=1 Tax=Alkalilimnicola ehrlichii TaxID=351052 RepID=UPI000E2F4595|nr:nicotinate-nucleotide adenylyltransferase [Alkalilimnicola ehrlichii]
MEPPIGVFGGTFDPVHLAHLRMALEVWETVGLAEVRLVPCQIPPHRDTPQLSAEQRLALLRAGSEVCPAFRVDTRELERPGPSYMADTLASLRAELPHTPLCLILGMDAFAGLPRWHRWRELAEYAHIIVMERPGSELPVTGELAEWLAPRQVEDVAALRQALNGRVFRLAVTQLDISATQIRALLNERRSIQFLVPEPVWHLIREQGLYGYGEA